PSRQAPGRRRRVLTPAPDVLGRIPLEPPDPLLKLELECVAEQFSEPLLTAPVVGGRTGGLFAGESCVNRMRSLIRAPHRQAEAAAADARRLRGHGLLVGGEDETEARADDVEGAIA